MVLIHRAARRVKGSGHHLVANRITFIIIFSLLIIIIRGLLFLFLLPPIVSEHNKFVFLTLFITLLHLDLRLRYFEGLADSFPPNKKGLVKSSGEILAGLVPDSLVP
jgi:hypothetical protein